MVSWLSTTLTDISIRLCHEAGLINLVVPVLVLLLLLLLGVLPFLAQLVVSLVGLVVVQNLDRFLKRLGIHSLIVALSVVSCFLGN